MGAAEVIPALPPGFEADPPPPPGFQLDGARAAAPAGPPLRGAAAIPGGEAPRAPEPVDARSPLRRMLDEVHGVVGSLQATVEGVVGGGLGAAGGLLGGLAGAVRTGQYGTQQGAAGVTAAVEGGAQRLTREPNSPEARRNMENVIGPVMQAMAPLTGHMGDLAGAGAAPPARVGELLQPVRDAAGVLRETPVPGVKQAPAGFVAPAAAAVRDAATRKADLAGKAIDEGIPLNIHHISGSKMVKLAGELLDHVPLSGSKRPARQDAFNNGLARAMDPEATHTKLTPDAFSEMQDKAGATIGEVMDRTPVPETAFGDLTTVARRETPDVQKVIETYAGDVARVAAENDGVVPGTVLRKLRTEAQTQARSTTNGDLRRTLGDFVKRLDDALSEHAAEGDMATLGEARRQYAISKVLEPLVAKSTDGDISPAALMGAVTRTNEGKRRMARGRGGELGEYAKIGKQFLSDTKTSNTTERFMVAHVLTSALGALKMGAAWAPATLYNVFGPRIARAMVERRRSPPATPEAPPPPFNPGLEAGFEPPPTQRPPAAPLGDLTPEWETAPGAAPPAAPEGMAPTGMVPAVDEAVPLRAVSPVAAPDNLPANVARDAGSQIPAVPGRPDLPDTMVAGPPAEAAATERANAAMGEPGAIEARRLRAAVRDVLAEAFGGKMSVIEGQPEIPVTMPKAGEIPVGKVIEGQPEIKANVPTKPLPVGEAKVLTDSGVETQPAIPVGQAKELYVDPKRPEAYNLHDAAWRKEFGLGNDDAVRAAQTRAALEVDAPAVERAAVQFENSPTRFDREVQSIIEKGAEDASQAKQAVEGGEGTAPAATPAGKAGADSAPAAGAERPQAGTAGGQAPTEKLDLLLPKIDEGFMREQERTQAAKRPPANPRGVEAARFALEKGKADKTLDADGVDLALWALQKNPNLANDMRVAIKDAPADGISKGSYNTATALVSLFKGNTNPTTAMHEILHHIERMLPQAVQDGIRREWKFAVEVAMRKAGAEQRAVFRDLQDAMNKGDHKALERVQDAVKTGVLDANEMYQLVNPTEFWAVNGARILHERFTGRGTWRAEARQWLKEMIEQVKQIVGLRSDAPVLKALDEVLNPRKTTGERRTSTMIDGSG